MRILVATDGSTESGAAVRFGAVLTQRLGGTLILVHVLLPSQERAEGEGVLRSAQATAAECGVQGDTRLEVGDLVEAIVGVRRQIGADMLVVGTHGRKGLPRVVLGSVAESLYKSAPFPVAVVRKFEQTARGIGPLLAPVDFSEGATHAARAAAHLARKLGVRLSLIHVLSEVVPGKGGQDQEATRRAALALRRDAEARLQALTKELGLGPEQIEFSLVTGVDSAQIDHVAAEMHAGCIVMGTRGLTGLPRVLLGSVTDQVVQQAPCPVLIVPPWTPTRGGWWREVTDEAVHG